MSKTICSLKQRTAFVLISISLALLTGCATTGSPDNDPLEGFNRKVTSFNLKADRWVLVPVAKGYQKILPQPVRNGVNNFVRNLREPYNVLNDLLQGQFRLAAQDTGRFLINTILGAAGLNDVASYLDMPRRNEDFGQTLAVWGVPSGPHLVIPFLGPSNFRDTVGLVPDFAYTGLVSPERSAERTAAWAIRVVNARTQFLGVEEVIELQPDPYLFLREGYRQQRQVQISNNKVSEEDSDDALLEELLEE
jgi:phospholipid-binding lipoprotein MlaA